ncbi:hypothetical protein B0H34DRAFT_795552 [Crassisporium funariophilum]|nr:hypothetical protein B0H34DRAFT_795552 [Crassisporium funariophilum]
MVGLQTATTAPHPPPGADEDAPSTSIEVFLKQRSVPILVKTISWSVALAEIAVIIASQSPSRPISQQILSKFVISGSSENIRPTALFFLGTFMAGLGGYIRYSCYRALGRLFTFEMSIRKDHRLVTGGPYAVVRHPGYTGVLVTVSGFICWHGSAGSWARECGAYDTWTGRGAALTFLVLVTATVTGLMTRMSKEDDALRRTFGRQWDEWAIKVPYKLVPWVY